MDFVNKGYVLADRHLLSDKDELTNVRLILGRDFDRLLPVTTKIFGDPSPSCYLETPCGVILTSNVDRLLHNLSFLPGKVSPSSLNSIEFDLPSNANSGAEANFVVMNDHDKIFRSELLKAADEILKEECSQVL